MATTNTKQTEMEAMNKPARAYDNEKRMVLFQNNERKDQVRDPIMRGNFVINGKKYWVSLWTELNTKDGKNEVYWAGQIQDEDERRNAINQTGIADLHQAQVRAQERAKRAQGN